MKSKRKYNSIKILQFQDDAKNIADYERSERI